MFSRLESVKVLLRNGNVGVNNNNNKKRENLFVFFFFNYVFPIKCYIENVFIICLTLVDL